MREGGSENSVLVSLPIGNKPDEELGGNGNIQATQKNENF
jgi:hypothetical protein